VASKPHFGAGDLSFIAAGKVEGVRQLIKDFYQPINEQPNAKVRLEMHKEDLSESIDRLTRFVCDWLGGPKLFNTKYGPIRIPKAHAHLDIGYAERDAWLDCMQQMLSKQHYEQNFKKYLLDQLAAPAERSRNK
jgi:hemoglobin|tara:strand:- start:4104 stop:4505 length:402 start_codon:yes stop_codon:yes gene_type:complete